ncbi:MAG: GtrA family protein [Defluviitaleaceae bacterium]|nr:GtrA family protein [Defluviitaleaceae bacterium]
MKILNILGIYNKADFFNFVKQFIRFGLVGLFNTFLFLAIYYALVLLGVFYLIANIIAFVISVISAFFLSRRFVFTSAAAPIIQLIKMYVVYGATFLLSTATLFLMVEILNLSAFIAPLINLCFTVPLNFLLNKFWAFR